MACLGIDGRSVIWSPGNSSRGLREFAERLGTFPEHSAVRRGRICKLLIEMVLSIGRAFSPKYPHQHFSGPLTQAGIERAFGPEPRLHSTENSEEPAKNACI